MKTSLKKQRIRGLCLCALFASLTAIGAFLKIQMPPPFPPITLQFQFCALAGILLGKKFGTLSQLLYVITGLIGFPIFTRGGGPQYIFQLSFGYLIGFIAAAYLIGRFTENGPYTFKRIFFSSILGLLSVYAIGASYMYMLSNLFSASSGKAISLWGAIYGGAVIFAPGDILLCLAVSFLAVRIIPVLQKEQLLIS